MYLFIIPTEDKQKIASGREKPLQKPVRILKKIRILIQDKC